MRATQLLAALVQACLGGIVVALLLGDFKVGLGLWCLQIVALALFMDAKDAEDAER